MPVRPPSKVAIRNYGIIRTNYPRHKPHTKSKRRATLRLLLLLLLLPGSSKIGPNCGIIKNLLRFTTLPTYSLLGTQGTRYWIALGCSYQETDKLQSAAAAAQPSRRLSHKVMTLARSMASGPTPNGSNHCFQRFSISKIFFFSYFFLRFGHHEVAKSER